MYPEVFLEGQIYEVEVEDCRKNADEGMKADAEVYSRVTKILAVDRWPTESVNQNSKNQESRIMQSPNQAINQLRLAARRVTEVVS